MIAKDPRRRRPRILQDLLNPGRQRASGGRLVSHQPHHQYRSNQQHDEQQDNGRPDQVTRALNGIGIV
jgi:hypothetical protein